MKTFSIIVIIFTFGFFGWFGFQNKTYKKEPIKINIDYKIVEAENRCAKLELKIQSKQYQIENK